MSVLPANLARVVFPAPAWGRAACTLLIASALAGCATPSGEPRNLSTHKLELVAYEDAGEYDRQIAAVAARAQAWIERRAAKPAGEARLAVVFDLDETLLRNLPHIRRQDFGYVSEVWHEWVATGGALAIEPVRAVYRAARRVGADVFFITGRGERDRDGTERNLRAIDCADYAALILKPADHRGTAAEYKTAARRRLSEAGHVIIANIGDQESDLAGGFAERTFKLPNPFYLIE